MEFLRVARGGHAAVNDGWKVSYLHTRRTAARIGINLNKRMVRHASSRNRLRRVLRERFRQLWSAALPSVDILLQPIVPPTDERAALQTCAALLADIPHQPSSKNPKDSQSSKSSQSVQSSQSFKNSQNIQSIQKSKPLIKASVKSGEQSAVKGKAAKPATAQ